jgi:hypothetical protein
MRRRRRYARLKPPPDLWADLGPGDPGYRLRPGRTGFDPFETQQEMARSFGLLLKSTLLGRVAAHPMPSLITLLALHIVLVPSLVFSLRLDFLLPMPLGLVIFGGAYVFLLLCCISLLFALARRVLNRH